MATREIYGQTFDEDVSSDRTATCAECGGQVRTNSIKTACEDCGLIIDEPQIDHGPEWRSYNEKTDSQSRVGPPRTVARHDNGLSTEIGRWRDGNGNQLAGSKRSRLSRMRREHSRGRFGSKSERNLAHGLGGMGIIVLMIAILPELAVNGAQLMESEAPGPELQKLTPRIAETARVLWLIYFGFTLVLIGLLYGAHLLGFAPNMNLYNAIAHGFTTLPTGGFSPQADSIAAFGAVVQWIILPFMVIAGVNFALFWHVLKGEFRVLVDNPEFRGYMGATAVLIAVLSVVLVRGAAPPMELGGVTEGLTENTIRQAAFQIGSLLNSTGYATADFAQWGEHAQMVLLFAMFIGGSAGSTGGGVKVVRWLITLKAIRRELYTTIHPDVVRPVRLGGQIVDEDAIRGIMVFTVLYIFLFAVSAVFLSLDSARIGYELSALEAISASLATLGNIGPGFGSLGPFGSFRRFSDLSKLLMVFLMWIGRLEIVPVLALFVGRLKDR